jgi:hypothetical protein
MVKVQRQAKKTRRGLKKSVTKTKLKSKRAASDPNSVKRHRPAPESAPRTRRQQPPVTATNGQVRAAVVEAPAEGQQFPLFWPALGWMRMWLGPRKTSHAAGD